MDRIDWPMGLEIKAQTPKDSNIDNGKTNRGACQY